MNLSQDFDQNWNALAAILPADRDSTARQTGAFTRAREIRTCDDLLRLAFYYSWCNASFRDTAAAANEKGIASITDVAILNRFRKMITWLQVMIAQTLQARLPPSNLETLPYRVRIVDGSSLSLRKSKGTDYRLHASYCLLTQCLNAVKITDANKGESFQNYEVQKDDLFMADRIHDNRAGIAHVIEHGGHVLVRLSWNHLPLQTVDGEAFNLIEKLKSLKSGQIGDWKVQTSPDTKNSIGAIQGRVVAIPKSTEATETAVRKARKDAKKKKQNITAETIVACGYIFIFTTLPACEVSGEVVLALYRFRWQIECAFKQLKSQLDFDRINCYDPDLVMNFLLCKLLGVLLLEDLSCRWFSFSPEDYDNEYPVNKWRVWTSLWRVLVSALEMTASLLDWQTEGHLYKGYYHDSRRNRKKQNLSQILNLTLRPQEA